MDYKLEIIGFTIEGCLAAQRAGTDRIELCDNSSEGGTTPSYGFIKMARQKLDIDLYPIIRPRGGDFYYSDAEFEIMKADIICCRQLGCDGIVTGILLPDGTLDQKRNAQLVNLAYPMGATLHRAFDRAKDGEKSLEDAITCGFERILTSGFFPNATEGAANIRDLIKQANGRISIMPGSGIRSSNIKQIANATGATEFHSSAKKLVKTCMEYDNPVMEESLTSLTVDVEEVRQMKKILEQM